MSEAFRDVRSDEEAVLLRRLVQRQGESGERARELVDRMRRGEPAEIDPALLEGLDGL
jgi:hypothetical protein